MRGQRRTSAQWQQLLGEFEASGQTAKAFCKTRGISPSNFFKRRSAIKARNGSAFVATRVNPGSSAITLQVEEVSIRCGVETSPVWLAQLVTALRA